MEQREVTSSLWNFVVNLAKSAPSIEIGEQLVADKPWLTGGRPLHENLHAKKSVIDRKLDFAPVAAMAETSA